MWPSQSFTLLFFSLISFYTIANLPQANAQKKCRAIVLQGGGDKGAYEAGVLYGLVTNTKNPEDFQYDVVTGISVGTINGIWLAQFAKGNELSAVNYLVRVWENLVQSDIFQAWPGGTPAGLFFEPSIYDSSPELTLLETVSFGPPNKRKLTVVTTDINTGKKVKFNEQYWGDNATLAAEIGKASSAIPSLFTYVNFGDYTLVDGGWSGEGLDVEDAILRCREVVDNDDDIIVDVMFANNVSFTDLQAEGYKTMQVLSRYRSINNFVKSTRAYDYARKDYPNIDFRYVFIASQRLPNQDLPLDFNATNIKTMIDLGIQDAITALNEGPEASVKKVLEASKKYRQ